MKELIKKTGLLLMVLFAGFAVSSCSDDDDPPGVQNDLVGTWRVVDSYWAEYEDGELYYESNDSYVSDIYVLNQNGSIEVNGYTEGTWGASGDAFYITYNEDGDVWTEQYRMVKESANRVTISYDISYNEDGTSYRDVLRLTLERQSGGSGDDDPIVTPPEPGDEDQPGYDDIPQQDPGATVSVTVQPNDLLGSWRMTFGYAAGYQNGELQAAELYTPDEGIGDVITFNPDGTFSITNEVGGTWRIDGTKVSLTSYEDGYTDTVEFIMASFDGNKFEWRVDYFEEYDSDMYHSVESQTFERV